MAQTRIADVIIPEVFADYVTKETMEKNALFDSGIMTPNQLINEFLAGGGTTVNLPYWTVISGSDEVLSDARALTPGSNKAAEQVAIRLLRGKAWSTNELAGVFAGDDPMGAIVKQVGAWWKSRQQQILLSVAKGVFDGPLATTHVNDISTNSGAAAVISADATLDTKQLLGDAADQITAVMMHSATKTALQKQNLIETIPNARGEVAFQTYLGYRIIIDDNMPVNAGVYDTYFFRAGAIGYGDAKPVGLTEVETDRDSLAGVDYLMHRKSMCLHPEGLSFVGTGLVDPTPNNTELATGANWAVAHEDKKEVGLLCLRHKLA